MKTKMLSERKKNSKKKTIRKEIQLEKIGEK